MDSPRPIIMKFYDLLYHNSELPWPLLKFLLYFLLLAEMDLQRLYSFIHSFIHCKRLSSVLKQTVARGHISVELVLCQQRTPLRVSGEGRDGAEQRSDFFQK